MLTHSKEFVMTDFTVVICTHNGEKRLPQVLNRLRSQINTETFTWELIVVDNNSQDNTAQVISDYQAQWNGICTLRYSFEPEQGLAHARRCAIRQVQSLWVGFLDDDNLPAPDWVEAAYEFSQRYPQIGAFGSQILGQFEVPPPLNFQRIASCLAIIDRGNQPFRYHAHRGVLPAGAGMVVNTAVWNQCVPPQPILLGVCGLSLATKGEDVETLSYIRQAGYEIWHNPAMQLRHYIPKERLQRDYLLRLFQSIGLNRYTLRMLHYYSWQRPVMGLVHGLNDAKRLVQYVLQNWQTLYRRDLVSECEFMLHWSSLVSPFYHWSNCHKGNRLFKLHPVSTELKEI
jgi:glycosyltransferase involved in cell wall biosynthesis